MCVGDAPAAGRDISQAGFGVLFSPDMRSPRTSKVSPESRSTRAPSPVYEASFAVSGSDNLAGNPPNVGNIPL